MSTLRKIVHFVTVSSYLLASFLLAAIALVIMGWSIYEAIMYLEHKDFRNGAFISIMLQSVGAIVISVAIIDVAKYMAEEVLSNKKLDSTKDARETIIKITVVIYIALSIEGLVYIFKAGVKDMTLLLYPVSLIITAAVLMVGLGVYQKISVKSKDT